MTWLRKVQGIAVIASTVVVFALFLIPDVIDNWVDGFLGLTIS